MSYGGYFDDPHKFLWLKGAHIFAYSIDQSKVALNNTIKRMIEIAATGQYSPIHKLYRRHDEQVEGNYPTFPLGFDETRNEWRNGFRP
ncbi:hypothetical protein KBB76_01480 [Candidatus Saccharibacteria bacterium]|nr:hypothetical protein [Candidatus Saccharibacteria bacterium]HOR23381.1 hypothetical protein [Candidatus Saccharibacteria bacterium]